MMKRIITAGVFILASLTAIAQTPENRNPEVFVEAPPKDGKVYTLVEQMPYFPGGEEALLKYLGKNIKYPKVALDAGTQGTVFITFVINAEGEVTQVKVLRGITGKGAAECANEALRVVSEMPMWAPGMQNHEAVSVQYNLPIKYTIPGKAKKSKRKKRE